MSKPCRNCGYIERRMDNLSYEQFLMFWNAYPRKVGKGAVEKIWAKMKGDVTLFTKILTAVNNQKMGESWQKDGGVYIPHPATWLNQRRWDDEPVVKWKDPFAKPEQNKEKIEAVNAQLERLKEREIQRIHGVQ